MENNKGKYALITGGSNGIGYEIAKLFAKDGYNLVLVARTQEKLEEVANEFRTRFGIQVVPIAKDLFNPTAPKEIYREVKASGLDIYALVNDAGQGEWGPFAETDIDRELDIIQLNVSSLVQLTKLFLKDMIQKGEGKILQVSSLLGKVPGPLMAVYSATKSFVLTFTEALHSELKDTGVTITALLPGGTDTDFFHKAGAENTKEYLDKPKADPADVAKDGYGAMMRGDDKIVSGTKNKLMATMANMMPDTMLADNMHDNMKQKEPERSVKGEKPEAAKPGAKKPAGK